MDRRLIEHLQTLANEGNAITNSSMISRWKARVSTFLSTAVGASEQEAFDRLARPPYMLNELGGMVSFQLSIDSMLSLVLLQVGRVR